MDIGSIPHPAFPSLGYAINVSRDGRTSLPVAPGMVIYSHFKHISGTPAPEGTQGVNISKLRILDTLIEQLSKMKNRPDTMDLDNLNGDDEQRINVLIEQYQKQIKAAQSASVYSPVSPATGILFSIVA